MIKLVMAATAAFLGFAAPANAADSAHCNVLDNGSGINKEMLSEFDECWLDTHEMEENSGVLKGIAWVRLGDEYYSVSVRKLLKAGSADAAVALFGKIVGTEVLNDELEIALSDLNNKESTTVARIDAIQTIIQTIEVEVVLDGALQDQLKMATDELTEIREQIANAHTVANAIRSMNGPNGLVITRDIETAIGSIKTFMVHNSHNLAHNFGTRYFNDAVDNNVYTTAMKSERYNSLMALAGLDFADVGTWTADDLAKLGTLNGIANSITDDIRAAYAAGFDDGYDRGYNEGYADGFRDGVHSVTN